jgi:hypothetical protein
MTLFPQASPNTTWSQLEMQDLALHELEQTMAEFHGDPARSYLAGYSMGGVGAYRIAYRSPEEIRTAHRPVDCTRKRRTGRSLILTCSAGCGSSTGKNIG